MRANGHNFDGMTAPTEIQTPRGAAPKRTTLRWAPALWAAYAQAVAFAAAAVTAFLVTDIASAFGASPGTRLWPLGAFAVGLVVAANATRRTGTLGNARYTGAIALGALALGSLAVALSPGFGFAVAAAGAFGTAAGFAIALSGRVLAAFEVGDGNGSVALSAGALLAGIAAGVGALFAVPLYGWRGVFGLVVVAAVLAAWKFAENVPDDARALKKCDVRFDRVSLIPLGTLRFGCHHRVVRVFGGFTRHAGTGRPVAVSGRRPRGGSRPRGLHHVRAGAHAHALPRP
ncbi:hypothetical protein [Glycomyces sp. NPDC048151]|uniref:hypothetical protein n=1 Tax=Glycomyces sp. NPDC048151 TaxID=3364002 RepID=UPI00371FCD49